MQSVGIEEDAIKDEGEGGETGGESIDAIDEIYGVCDEYRKDDGEQDLDEEGELIDPEESMEIIHYNSTHKQEETGKDLSEELGTVFHTNEVVGHTDKVKNCDGTGDHADSPEVDRDFVFPHETFGHGDNTQNEKYREEHSGEERYPAETRHGSLMNLARIGFVEEFFSEGDQQDLRDNKASDHHIANEDCYVKIKPHFGL